LVWLLGGAEDVGGNQFNRMSEIHYFPRYSQPENVVTNNTLLLLLRLHQYNRFKFEKFMDFICADQEIELASSWLQFRQQKGTGKSIVDGFIAQDSLKIAVETKLKGIFDPRQLENHFAVFSGEQHKLLILLSPALGEIPAAQLALVRQQAVSQNIQLIHASFEDIVTKARKCLSEHDEEMLALVTDYELFCSDLDLLPRDQFTLFVPPCGQSFEANERLRLYYCPATWSRRKARYLGIYAQKSVRAIGEIAKTVVCTVDVPNRTVTAVDGGAALTSDEQQRIIEATIDARTHNWDITAGHKFYLCDTVEPTDFRKTSRGGIMGHRYFDLEDVLGSSLPHDLATLAALLRQHQWE
jgi:hypothetical protein